jgi:hypothetical protein
MTATLEATMTSDRVNVVLAQVEGFRQRLHDIQREMDPLMDEYENLKSINNRDDERLHDALAMVWNAWWDISDTVGYLRAAQRRLRDEDGILADVETER